MFIRKSWHLQTVEFKYDSSFEGKIDIAVGIIGLAFTAVLIYAGIITSTFAMITAAAIYAACTAWGAYQWRLRRTPMKRQVKLGGLRHRLYLRSRWLFMLYAAAVRLADFAALIAFYYLLRNNQAVSSVIYEGCQQWLSLLPLVLGVIGIDYLSYYYYFRTPTSMRRVVK